jgi:Holliday junction resolvase RusA-like endonuclease
MYKLSSYIKNLAIEFPQIKKATTKPCWEKWMADRQQPTHRQLEKLISLIPVEESHRQYFRVALFQMAKKHHKKGAYHYKFHINPMACPRPRFTKFGRPYMPKKYMDWKKELVKMMGDKEHGLNHPVKMRLDFIFYNENKPWGPHHQKPDVDNLVKGFMDACQDGGMLVDDSVVYSIQAKKLWGYSPMIKCIIEY